MYKIINLVQGIEKKFCMHAQIDESADVSGIFSKFENSKRFNFQTTTPN
jgi:hypothetical protein